MLFIKRLAIGARVIYSLYKDFAKKLHFCVKESNDETNLVAVRRAGAAVRADDSSAGRRGRRSGRGARRPDGERGRARALGGEHHQGAQDLGGGGAYRCGVLWRRAGHGAFRCKGGEQHGRTARGGGADPHVDDDGSCVYRDGHHLCADRGHPDHLRIVTITRKVE